MLILIFSLLTSALMACVICSDTPQHQEIRMRMQAFKISVSPKKRLLTKARVANHYTIHNKSGLPIYRVCLIRHLKQDGITSLTTIPQWLDQRQRDLPASLSAIRYLAVVPAGKTDVTFDDATSDESTAITMLFIDLEQRSWILTANDECYPLDDKSFLETYLNFAKPLNDIK